MDINLFQYERQLWSQGYTYIAGIDEAGRGCLFGDVVAATVIFSSDDYIEGINDSKKLSPARRASLYDQIMEQAQAVGVGRADAHLIDQINIRQATRLAMKRAVESLSKKPDYLLIDAETVEGNYSQMSVVKGDQSSFSIAAASIVAKVTRDRLCDEWDQMYPEYGLKHHKGYATAKHREAIQLFGPTPLHRRTFLKNIHHTQQSLF